MRRQQILRFRAAGLFPPVPAHERERWEQTYGDDVRAFTREHPIDINGPPPNERILKDWAEYRQVRATQKLSPVIDAHPAKARGGKPLRACPYCGQEFKALHWHVDKCPRRPRPEAA